VQGAALDPATGLLWTTEHGAMGGDELNRPEAGKNYGWPIITYGRDYSGAKIGIGTQKEGLEQPVYYWNPSIATSGLAFYTGEYTPWRGNAFAGGLAGMHVARLMMLDSKVAGEERLAHPRRAQRPRRRDLGADRRARWQDRPNRSRWLTVTLARRRPGTAAASTAGSAGTRGRQVQARDGYPAALRSGRPYSTRATISKVRQRPPHHW
jgi:aldose sugar dehydrogenase